MTGVVLVAGRARKAFSSPNPSRRGIITSDKTRSGWMPRSINSSAAWPSSAEITENRCDNRRVTYSRMSRLSSTSRTQGIFCAPTAPAGGSGWATARYAPLRSALERSGNHRCASSTKAWALLALAARWLPCAIWPAGKCAVPDGMLTRNVLPRPRALSTSIEPPCSPMSSRTRDSPMPEPSWVRPTAPGTR